MKNKINMLNKCSFVLGECHMWILTTLNSYDESMVWDDVMGV